MCADHLEKAVVYWRERAAIDERAYEAVNRAVSTAAGGDLRSACKGIIAEFPDFPGHWPEGEDFVQREKEREVAGRWMWEAFVRSASRLYRHLGQVERGLRTSRALPYWVLLRSTLETPCPLHLDGNSFKLILPPDHAFWEDRPLCRMAFCNCSFMAITRMQFERALNDPEKPALLSPPPLEGPIPWPPGPLPLEK